LTGSTGSGEPPKSFRYETGTPLPPVADPLLIAAATRTAHVGRFKYLASGEYEGLRSGLKAITRPALPVALIDPHDGPLAMTRGLLDSGADFTTFSHAWAEMLGIDLRADCTPVDVSIADDEQATHLMYDKGMEIEVVGERMFLPIVFFCVNLPVALLGRRDFFNRYLVLLDNRESHFYLERRLDPKQEGTEDVEGDYLTEVA
jgi:hypothetical protein